MNNILKVIVIVLLIPLAFSSCKDDENKGASLVGTWEEVSFVASGCVDANDNESYSCTSSCERIVVTANTITIGSDPAINGFRNQQLQTKSWVYARHFV